MSIEALEERLARLEKQNRELMDRQEIRDIVTRFCHGVDRLDRELMLSCYHPDAVDDHGIFMGSASELADWVLPTHKEHQVVTHHGVTNHLCELDGDVAHAVSYYYCADVNKEGPPLFLCGGRYIDRFERRDGKWAIADRVHRMEWWGAPCEMTAPEKIVANPEHETTRDRSDPSYQRPLTITQKTAGWRIPW